MRKLKYVKLFEEIDFSEGFGEKLRNYIETNRHEDGRIINDREKFQNGIRVFIPQNCDRRTISYKTEGGWVLHSDQELKKEKVSFFVVSPDGKLLTCKDYNNIFSSGDKSTLLETFNNKFKTSCIKIDIPNVW